MATLSDSNASSAPRQIEELGGACLAETRAAVAVAVSRAFERATGSAARPSVVRAGPRRVQAARRPPEEMERLAERLFEAVVVDEEGHVHRAARRLHISQPPPTRSIHNLEDELGTPLFQRTPRGMALLPRGEAFPMARTSR